MNTHKTSLAVILAAATVVISTTAGTAEAQGSADVSHDRGIWYFQGGVHAIPR